MALKPGETLPVIVIYEDEFKAVLAVYEIRPGETEEETFDRYICDEADGVEDFDEAEFRQYQKYMRSEVC